MLYSTKTERHCERQHSDLLGRRPRRDYTIWCTGGDEKGQQIECLRSWLVSLNDTL